MKKLFSTLLISLVLLSSFIAIAEEWTCLSCGKAASGNFCSNCGAAKPSDDWVCMICGNAATGNFCSNCGAAKNTNTPIPTNEPISTPMLSQTNITPTPVPIVSQDIVSLIDSAISHKRIATNPSPDKYTWYIQDYVGLNMSSIGYTSLGGSRLDKYGSAYLKLNIIAIDGSYVDIDNDYTLSQYVVVGQNYEPNTMLTLVYQKNSRGEEYSNLIDSQSIEDLDLLVAKKDGTITWDVIDYTPIAVTPSKDKYTCHIRNYVGKNAASFGYTSLGGKRLEAYSDAHIEINFVTADGTYLDYNNENLLQQYVVVGQNMPADTEFKLVYEKNSSGVEYDNLIESQGIETIDLQVVRLDGELYNDIVNYIPVEINASPDKYTCYIRNYVGKNLSAFGYTSLGGKRMESYSDAYIEFVLATPDGSALDVEDEEQLASYVVVDQDIKPNTIMHLTYEKNSKGEEYSNLVASQTYKKLTLTLAKVNPILNADPVISPDEETGSVSIPVSSQNRKNYQDFDYCLLEDGTVGILKYTGIASSLKIPKEIDGYKVTVIGNEAFKNNKNIESIDMAKSITTIGDSAFEDCSELERIYYFGSAPITAIGACAFKNCSSLEQIDIPKSLTTIADSTFEGCADLERAYYLGSSKVASIGKSAFKGCTSLEQVDIPKKTSTIGESAFEGCTNLERAYYLGSSKVASIEKNAFKNCSSLEQIDAPKTLTLIGESAFEGCTALEHIYYLKDKKVTFGVNAFANCPNLDNMPKGVVIDESSISGENKTETTVHVRTPKPIPQSMVTATPKPTAETKIQRRTPKPVSKSFTTKAPKSEKKEEATNEDYDLESAVTYLLSPEDGTAKISIINFGDGTFTALSHSGKSYLGAVDNDDDSYLIELMATSGKESNSTKDVPYDYSSQEFKNLLNYLLRVDRKTIVSIIPLYETMYTAIDSSGRTYLIEVIYSDAMIMVALIAYE